MDAPLQHWYVDPLATDVAFSILLLRAICVKLAPHQQLFIRFQGTLKAALWEIIFYDQRLTIVSEK